ncbi:cupin domain-containing protein [Planktomarina sp.]|nr:cupin domain-containing protein [Planktomarina sp.]
MAVVDDGVRLVKPGTKYEGAQGVTYDAGVSRNTAGAEKVCMNVLPMPPGGKSKPHIHKGIETIAYMLEGECTLFHGQKLESQTLVKQGEQIFIPGDVPHAPCNLSDKSCVWIVVHSSGDDQDELIRIKELDYIVE